MAIEQHLLSPTINIHTSLSSLKSSPEIHSSTIPNTTAPTPVSSSFPIILSSPSNSVSLSCVENPMSPPFSDLTKEHSGSVTSQVSEVSKDNPDQYLNSSIFDSMALIESLEKEVAHNIMATIAALLLNEGAYILSKLQQKETFEFTLQKSKRSVKTKKKRLMIQAEFVTDKSIPVAEVDKDALEEPSSLVKRSTKSRNLWMEPPMKLLKNKVEHLQRVTEDVPMVYEDAVQNFCAYLFTVEGDHICVLVNGVDIVLDASALGKVLQIPCEGMSSVKGVCGANFRRAIMKEQVVQHGEQVHKKVLLPEYQLLFELVNKVLLPRSKRQSIATKFDLVLMEALDEFVPINLPAIMIYHMQKVANFKGGNHGLPYGFLLTQVFKFYKVPLANPKVGTPKQTFSKTTLEECECVEKVGGSISTIPQLINAQNATSEEIRRLRAQNAILETQLSQAIKGPGSANSTNEEVAPLDEGK
ncbi:uncharacterized protein [Nicotiana sylvestris]|uniref:uncharacterized protein n=1 Tax=Nicotiana sylvestris TaxID=4096 RepID=UPI00388CA48B